MAHHGTRSYKVQPRVRRGAAPVVLVVVLVLVALIITIGAAMNRRRGAQRAADTASATAATAPAEPVPAEVMRQLENIPPSTWQQAGTKGATVPVFVGDSDRVDGKPVVLYVGAGFCPYCAAARWSMVTALSRFGKFSGLTYGASSAEDVFPSTPTFSFYKSSYASDYVAFQSVELEGDVRMPNGRYNPLETPTPAQDALLRKYDAPPFVSAQGAGGIPFILVGGRYMWSGSPFNPGLLGGKTQAAIAATLAQGSGDAASAILSNGNELTATICALDGGKPAQVCSTPEIQSAIKALPTKTP